MVTADVSSLYTIIQHDNALLALNWAFSQREDIPFIQKKFLRLVLQYCLTHNYCWYGGHFYTQRRGAAMGAKFAPSLANLMGGQVHLCPGGLNCCFFKRYIDDLFFTWAGTEESLKDFMNFLNCNPNNIKLDYQYSKEQVNYMDVTVLINSGKLITKVYFKSSD